MEQFSRTSRILGQESIVSLKDKKVAIFGLGGVGSYVVEALCRMGIGKLVLIDHDTVDISNINRQIYALHSTIGKNKVDIARDRCLDINPHVQITTYQAFYLPEQDLEYMFEDCDYVIDAIDTIKAKIALVEACNTRNIPIICSMGTGNKIDPSRFEIVNINQTSVCPLAKVMRRELKQRGINKCMVLYSKEEPIKVDGSTPGSVPFVPSVAGLMIAGYVIRQLLNIR